MDFISFAKVILSWLSVFFPFTFIGLSAVIIDNKRKGLKPNTKQIIKWFLIIEVVEMILMAIFLWYLIKNFRIPIL